MRQVWKATNAKEKKIVAFLSQFLRMRTKCTDSEQMKRFSQNLIYVVTIYFVI